MHDTTARPPGPVTRWALGIICAVLGLILAAIIASGGLALIVTLWRVIL